MIQNDTCRKHPDRPAVARCTKYGHGQCLECLENDPHCSDPEIYCKFRTQCVIFEHLKELRRKQRQAEETA